ncbi:MAG TPA: carboxypeptidase regulatory-like domain-containing protein [Bryobacteraceae bacterium]|nr:carboxypeptidase regulatory-like domain-containing protein [Bryobacteraceae bacterium]
MRLQKLTTLFLIGLIILAGGHALSQVTSGNITGTIYDATGATVPNATVTVRNVNTNVETSTVSTSTGEYHIPNLLVGTYSVAVTSPGFTRAELTNVSVPLNQTVTANVTLQVGATSTSVEVTTAAVVIDTSTAQVQSSFQTKEMMDLPTASSGSGVINLSLLNAGVASSGGVGQGTGPSIGGQRPTNNNFTIEGVDINNRSVTGPVVVVPNDAVAELSVLQNQFSPEFGHSSGGQFNQVVKSGTNEFHGALYEYFENRNLFAADNLNAVEGNPLHPRYDNNRFGGTFGGPIQRNKLFFFVNYEFNPIGQSNSTYYYAPTEAGYNLLTALPGVNQTNIAQLKQYMGTGPSAVSSVQVGPGNESLVTGSWLTGKGLTTIPLGEISTSLPSFANYENAVASVDYNISDKDSVRGRFVLNRDGFMDTAGYPAAFFTTLPTNSYVVTASEYHIFTPAITNELRLGYNRTFNNYPVTGQKFPGLDQFPNIALYELNASFGPDPNAPQYGIQNTYALADNVSWTRGAHSFKFGFDGWKSISPQVFLQRSRGDYEWSYLSDYVYDNYPDGIAQRSLGSGAYSGDQFLFGFFANDSWKVRPNFTVNLGLRYEYQTVPFTERDQVINSIASVPGLITFGEPKPQRANFMPRVGFAYSPGISGRTSIRGGFGINYDILYDNLGILSKAPEFQTTVDVTGADKSGFLAGGGIPPNVQLGTLSVADARAGTAGFIPNQKRPEAIQWNIGVQHVFAENYTIESRYLGTRGLFLPVQVQLNRQATVTPSNALPVYLSAPSQATLDALPNTLPGLSAAFDNGAFIPQAFLDYGFYSPITSFMPVGMSTYHGWANQLTRRFAKGLSLVGAYTWSHNIDNSTSTVGTTILTPRRPEDSQNLKLDRSDSALDHRQRFTFEVLYDVPFFQHSGWFMKNIVGNWEIAPVYTYQTGVLVTTQSATDSNLNGDTWDDRVIINPKGNSSQGSNVTALKNSNGDVVAYLATNPGARYIQAAKGTFPNGGRNLLHMNPIDDIDLTAAKKIDISERFKLEFAARAFNVLNHPQYAAGLLSDVQLVQYQPGTGPGTIARNTLIPSNPNFELWDQGFSSNPRTMMLSLKLIF